MNPKDFKIRKISNDKEHYCIANEDGVFVLKNGNISMVSFHLLSCWRCWWESKKEAEIFLAGWLALQQIDTNKFSKEQQYPLGMRYKDIYGMTWTYYHKIKPKLEFVKENKMTKEMTVAEIARALGYEVKVVKEQPKPKPYQFKTGDIAQFSYGKEKRIFIEINGVLYSLYLDGTIACYVQKDDKDRSFGANKYEKIGRLKDYIK